MRWILSLLTLTVLLPLSLVADDEKIDIMKVSAADFMRAVLNPPGRESWAKMEGKAIHRRSGSKTVEAPLRLGIMFTPASTIAQIVFDNNEFYNVGQSYGDAPVSTSDNRMPEGKTPRIGVFGISPQDLTMGFMYQPLLSENKPESVKSETCRVFCMEGINGKGWSRVYISVDYFFPLKVEFFSGEFKSAAKNIEPDRTLEITGFKKEKDFWVVKTLKLTGANWRTIIEFKEVSAGYTSDGLPKDVFLEQ